MRATTYRGPYRVRVEEKPDPRIEHPNDAVVRVERAAICGSDLHLYHGMMRTPGSVTRSGTSSSASSSRSARPCAAWRWGTA